MCRLTLMGLYYSYAFRRVLFDEWHHSKSTIWVVLLLVSAIYKTSQTSTSPVSSENCVARPHSSRIPDVSPATSGYARPGWHKINCTAVFCNRVTITKNCKCFLYWNMHCRALMVLQILSLPFWIMLSICFHYNSHRILASTRKILHTRRALSPNSHPHHRIVGNNAKIQALMLFLVTLTWRYRWPLHTFQQPLLTI